MGELGAVTIALWGSLVEASWVLVRVSAFVVTAPVLGARGAPGRVRLLLAIALTPLIALTVPPIAPPALFSSAWWLLMITNVAVGLMLGLMLQLLQSLGIDQAHFVWHRLKDRPHYCNLFRKQLCSFRRRKIDHCKSELTVPELSI